MQEFKSVQLRCGLSDLFPKFKRHFLENEQQYQKFLYVLFYRKFFILQFSFYETNAKI